MTEGTVKKSFCTTREAAVLLGVSVGTVQLWVESGLLQAWKTSGGHRRVLRESIDGLLHKGVDVSPPTSVELAPVVSTRPLNVLVVEDDDALLRLYKARLALWPIKPVVSLADNGVTGLLMMGRSNPDLLITDLDMPGLDGFNMLRVLHQTPEMRHATIVVVTGLDSAEVERRGGVPQGVEVLPKPVPFDRLLAIATAITKQRLSPGQVA
ncbi:response regulator [Rhodoferax sp. BLA1]|uniref:response regulator n=1 Tax=Rhodoferax sp. BLA1 TaxID=2576062 RepID=UPI0015D172C5|nr:response regulator [Rhodoferax sp. BLA1]